MENAIASEDMSDAEVAALEPLLHRLPTGSDRSAIDAILEEDFFEVGASGRVYSREVVMDVVEQRYLAGSDPDDNAWRMNDFLARRVADDLCLITYSLSFAERRSRRSTLWRRHGSQWRAVYHQGTASDLE